MFNHIIKTAWPLACLLAVVGAQMPATAQSRDSGRAGGDYPYQGRAGFSTAGTVSSVDADRDRVIITGDDGRTYTLDTYRSVIVLRGTSRAGETGDLVPGMRLQVNGTLVSSDIVEADRVSVLPYTDQHPAPERRDSDPVFVPDDPAPADSAPIDAMPGDSSRAGSHDVTLRGTVESVDDRLGSFVVRINDHTRTVFVDDRTDMSDLPSSSPNRLPLHEGDRVTVLGVLSPDGTVVANTVSLSRQALAGVEPPRTTSRVFRGGNLLTGTITGTSNRLTSRDIKVRISPGREITVHVPKDARVIRNGKGISVHELNKDEQVRINGSYQGEDFQARRIEVTGLYYDDNADR